jgi:hypothetical protein
MPPNNTVERSAPFVLHTTHNTKSIFEKNTAQYTSRIRNGIYLLCRNHPNIKIIMQHMMTHRNINNTEITAK